MIERLLIALQALGLVPASGFGEVTLTIKFQNGKICLFERVITTEQIKPQDICGAEQR